MNNSLYSLEVRVNNHSIKKYPHKGYEFVEARKNKEFVLRIKNNSGARILAVPSVDGLSTVDGKPAGWDSPGYIVEANNYLDIPGWRVDSDTIANFFFTNKKEAYAQKMSTSSEGEGNVGVIGVAIFSEKPKPVEPIVLPHFPGSWPYSTYPYEITCYTSSSNSPDPSVYVNTTGTDQQLPYTQTKQQANYCQILETNSLEQHLGVGFGEASSFPVTINQDFEKDIHTPITLLQLWYDSRKGLIGRGIDIDQKKRPEVYFPNSFPDKPTTVCSSPNGTVTTWKVAKPTT